AARGRDGGGGRHVPGFRHAPGRSHSPLLANVFLHEVLDTWFENEVKPRLKGRAFLLRYADDVTAVFSLEEDARRVWAVLPKRFARYGLTLHPEKTRLIAFRRPSGVGRGATARPESFD